MKKTNWAVIGGMLGTGLLLAIPQIATSAPGDRFSNTGGIANTRHNMTQSSIGILANGINPMDAVRNNYGEVCVYCHTPHGANANVQLPLWNRTIKATQYTTYNELGTASLTQPVTQPGVNSLACLSCHDGQVAVDSIINMPGTGGYNAAQATSVDKAWLSTWTNNVASGYQAADHWGIKDGECLVCHSGTLGKNFGDFTIFAIGTDLRNDHPVGIRYPAQGDFNQPDTVFASVKFFDNGSPGAGNGRPDKGEVRMYNTGDGYEVECSSCHDPHGVPSSGAGSTFISSFLRVKNEGSALCLTCHVK